MPFFLHCSLRPIPSFKRGCPVISEMEFWEASHIYKAINLGFEREIWAWKVPCGLPLTCLAFAQIPVSTGGGWTQLCDFHISEKLGLPRSVSDLFRWLLSLGFLKSKCISLFSVVIIKQLRLNNLYIIIYGKQKDKGAKGKRENRNNLQSREALPLRRSSILSQRWSFFLQTPSPWPYLPRTAALEPSLGVLFAEEEPRGKHILTTAASTEHPGLCCFLIRASLAWRCTCLPPGTMEAEGGSSSILLPCLSSSEERPNG